MADHGQLINSRTYWTWINPATGKPASGANPPVGGSAGATIAGIQTGIGASPAPAATQYHEYTYADGTKVLSRFDPAGQDGQGAWVQEDVRVDPQIHAQYEAAQKGEQGQKPQIITLPDGRKARVEGNTVVPLEGQGEKPPPNKQLVAVGGKRFVFDPETGTLTPAQGVPEEDVKQGDAPTPLPRAGAPRPGQRTDMNAVIDAANQYQQQLWRQYKAHQITLDQYDQQWNAYYTGTVEPARQRAQQEVNDFATTQ